MSINEKNIEYSLLAHQIEHEKKLSKLYKSYNKLFPDKEIELDRDLI